MLEKSKRRTRSVRGEVDLFGAFSGTANGGLIVAPPRRLAKTILLKEIAKSDPGESSGNRSHSFAGGRATRRSDRSRSAKIDFARFIIRTLTRNVTRHVQVAEMVLERAQAFWVEMKKTRRDFCSTQALTRLFGAAYQ